MTDTPTPSMEALRLQDALRSIEVYCSDTLSGSLSRISDWYIDAVRVSRDRAMAALAGLDHYDPAAMRAAGWVRLEEVDALRTQLTALTEAVDEAISHLKEPFGLAPFDRFSATLSTLTLARAALGTDGEGR